MPLFTSIPLQVDRQGLDSREGAGPEPRPGPGWSFLNNNDKLSGSFFASSNSGKTVMILRHFSTSAFFEKSDPGDFIDWLYPDIHF